MTATRNADWTTAGLPAVERCKREIIEDVRSGRVPATVASFSDLHDHVDANEYGGACEAVEEGIAAGWWDGDEKRRAASMAFWNKVQDAVHEWIVAGGIRDALAK